MGEPRLPDFVIVGAMRSGSTSLFRFFADHPDVFMVQPKEVHFFDKHYDKGLDWYKSRFAAAGAGQRAGEATPSYLSSRIAIQRLAEDVPRVQVIAILRDPIDRAYSHYWLRHARGRESRSWHDVVAQDLDSTEPSSVFWPSRYAIHLERLYATIGRPGCLVLSFDDLRVRPKGFFATACTFVGVEPITTVESDRRVNAYFEVRFHSLRNAMKHGIIPRRVRNAVARINQIETTYPPMQAGLYQELSAYFVPDRHAMDLATRRSLTGPPSSRARS